MTDKPVFAYIAAYDNRGDANLDYDAVRDLYSDGIIGAYDAAIVTKDEAGKVHIHTHEKPTEFGAWSGAAVGALVGILVPPFILATTAVGAAAGALIGHLYAGMSRSDIKDLGTLLDYGETALIVLGHDDLQADLDKATARAAKQLQRKLDVDADEFEAELALAVAELTADSE